MAQHEGNDDPAVYQSHSSRKDKAAETNGTSNGHSEEANGSHGKTPHSPDKHGKANHHEHEDDEEEDEEEDGTLLTVYPGFNRLMLALRDEGVMRFTKYVSAAAPGSVWDVCGEYEVVMTDDRGDEEGSSPASSEDTDKK